MEFKYKCSNCGKEYEINSELMLCPHCREESLSGKPLKGVLEVELPDELKNSEVSNIEKLLPIEEKYFVKNLVGNTPFLPVKNIEKKYGFNNIFVKNDSLNLTGSLKDRASYLVAAFAKKFNFKEIVLASTGNAASSMAGIAAAFGLKTTIFLPENAPKAKLIQCLQFGAKLIPVKGNYDSAYDLSLEYSLKYNKLNRNTAYNPMTIEGKKTVAIEMFNQLKKFNKENEKNLNIDYVFVPVGDGVILSGVIKGFLDLKYTNALKKFPKIIAVQSDKSSFIYNGFKHNDFNLSYKATTIADSISVDIARNGYKAVNDLKKVNGDVILVSDNEILSAQLELSKLAGVFSEPAGATSYAGFLKYREQIKKDETVAILITGNGLKDLNNASKLIKIPEAIEPNIKKVEEVLKRD